MFSQLCELRLKVEHRSAAAGILQAGSIRPPIRDWVREFFLQQQVAPARNSSGCRQYESTDGRRVKRGGLGVITTFPLR